MAIKLPGALKKLKPMHWAIIGGVVIAGVYLYLHKGTGAVANSGLVPSTAGGSAGLGTGVQPAPVSGQPAVDWTALLAQQQSAQDASNAAWQAQLLGMLGGQGSGVNPNYTGPASTPQLPSAPGTTIVPSSLGGLLAPISNGGLLAPFSPTPPPPAGLTQIAAPAGGVFNPNVFGPAGVGAGIGTSAAPQPLTAPSPDTVGLLNQYLYAFRNPPTTQSGAWGGFQNPDQVKSQIVQLMAQVLGNGSSYFGGYSIAPADVTLAQNLNATTPNINLYPQFASALAMGLNQTAVTQPMAGAVGATGVVSSVGVSPGGTTAAATAATAARIAQLQAAITTQTKNVAVNTAAGKTAAATTDKASLTTYQMELARLLGQ
jgi:hypothetical protein